VTLGTFLILLSCGPATDRVSGPFRTWAQGQADELVTRADSVAAAVVAGNRTQARALILEARTPFERLDLVVEALGDADQRLDAAADDVPADKWTGFRALDQALAGPADPPREQALARTLASDARILQDRILQDRIRSLDAGAGLLTSGTLGLLDEAVTEKLPELGSPEGRFVPGDLRANAEGAAAVWSLLGPPVRAAHPDRAAAVDAGFESLARALSAETPDSGVLAAAFPALGAAWKAALVSDAPPSASDLAGLQTSAADLEKALASGDTPGARDAFAGFQKAWLGREALVRNIDAGVYGAVETQAGTVRRELAGDKPGPQALAAARDIGARLAGLKVTGGFNSWDVGFLLFREGLEALLVLAALLAFLARTGQKDRVPWVWAGAATGLAASVAVAFVVSVLLAGWASATAPSLVEGTTGLVAVVLMLTVGAWLHGKANVKNWNLWLKESMGKAGNSPVALGALALLAVLREGAETVVFFWGLSGSLSPGDLALGVVGALVVLSALGVLVIGFSKRLPLNWFFPIATALIYYLAVKILGQSLGSLQSAGLLPATPLGVLGPVDFLGFAPTWETAVPQVVLTLVLAGLVLVPLVRRPAVK
jgi:high-affinity iron transporter